MRPWHFLLGCILGVILAASLFAASILVLLATGSLWFMGALYCGGTLGFALVGVGLVKYIESR